MSSNRKQYIKGKDFLVEHEKSLQQGNPSNKLMHYFKLIAENSFKILPNNEISPKDKETIINYGVSEAWRKWNTFDKTRTTNIFSYFTTVILNSMRDEYNLIFDKVKTKGKNLKFVSIDKLFNISKDA